MPGDPLVASLLLVAMPGAPSSVLAPSSDARRPLVASLLLTMHTKNLLDPFKDALLQDFLLGKLAA